MRTFDQQGQNAARLLPRREADRFRRRYFRISVAHNLSPPADDRTLDEAEALERHPAYLTDKLAGRARSAASRSFVGAGLLFRHLDMVMP